MYLDNSITNPESLLYFLPAASIQVFALAAVWPHWRRGGKYFLRQKLHLK